MKKALSLIIAMVMMISAFAALTVSAEETTGGVEGNWETHLDAIEEKKIENGEESHIPCPGYKYTDDGFEVVPPQYDNVQSKYTVISKTKYDTRNFSIKIRLDEYDVSGDNWVSFTFWSEKNGLAQGSNANGEFGYGWSSLLRDANTAYDEKDLKLSVLQGFNCGTKATPGGFMNMTHTEFEPLVDENGVQYIEFKVETMKIYINGAAVGSDNCKALRDAFKNDEYLAYFGISVKSGVSNLPIKFTILEVDGVKPTGSDSKEPEVKTRNFGEMRDPSTVPAGVPGVLFDATFENQNNKMPETSKCVVDLTPDNTFKVTLRDTTGSIWFSVRDDYSVDIKDFPYVVIVLKNFCTCEKEEGKTMQENCMFGETCGFFYCAGKTLSPDNEHRTPLPGDYMYDITPEGSEDYYTIFVAKATAADLYEGPARIHSLRFDYAQGNPTQEFEIMSAGYYRSYEDLVAHLTAQGYELSIDDLPVEDDYTDPEDPSEEENNGGDGYVDDNYDSYPGEDETEETTTAKEKEEKTTANASNDGQSEKKGCKSSVSMGVVALIATASIAGLVSFKKRKDD